MTAEELIAIAKRMPDIPRYVETRALLLANLCEVYGLEGDDSPNFALQGKAVGTISIVGQPSKEAIVEAVKSGESECDVLAFEENYSLVKTVIPDWRSEWAVLFLLGDSPSIPEVPAGMVRFLEDTELALLSGLSDELTEELALAAKFTRIAATIVDGKPVSFCYAGSVTEGLWDISIDTVEGYRNRGFAALAVAFMIDHFDRQGKKPVWGALESNTASMKLAAKLGFVPVDGLYVFEQ